MRTLLLTGAPGAGKTTTLTALMGVLEAADVSYAAVELEALALVHPWPDEDAAFAHLRFVADSFRRRGYPLLLVGATVEDGAYLRRTLDALGGEDVLLVRLTAPAGVLRERIVRREPADWVGLARLVDAAEPLDRSIAALPGIDLVLRTDAADPRTVAARIRDALLAP